MLIAIMTTSDSLKIIEVQQRIHDLEIQTRSFMDAIPTTFGQYGEFLAWMIAFLVLLIGYNAWKSVQTPKEFESLRTNMNDALGKVNAAIIKIDAKIIELVSQQTELAENQRFYHGLTELQIADGYWRFQDIIGYLQHTVIGITEIARSKVWKSEVLTIIRNTEEWLHANKGIYVDELYKRNTPESFYNYLVSEIDGCLSEDEELNYRLQSFIHAVRSLQKEAKEKNIPNISGSTISSDQA